MIESISDLYIEYEKEDKLYSMLDTNIISAGCRAIVESNSITLNGRPFDGFKVFLTGFKIYDVHNLFKQLPYKARKRTLDEVVNPYIRQLHGDQYQVKSDSQGFMVEHEQTEAAFKKYLSAKFNDGKPYN